MVTANRQIEPEFERWDDPADIPAPDEALVVNLEGFEGPLDLLLALARTQKVDLAKISVLALAEQYLDFVERALKLQAVARRRLSGDGRLARLPQVPAAAAARAGQRRTSRAARSWPQRLAFRLMRLEAMRDAAGKLMTRHRLGRDVFARGQPEGVRTIRVRKYTAMIFDLLKAYADQRKKTVKRVHVVPRRTVWSIKEARDRLEALLGESTAEWVHLDAFLQQYGAVPDIARTARASSFGATLEMAREGLIELSQAEPFAPIYMRKREANADWQRVT